MHKMSLKNLLEGAFEIVLDIEDLDFCPDGMSLLELYILPKFVHYWQKDHNPKVRKNPR